MTAPMRRLARGFEIAAGVVLSSALVAVMTGRGSVVIGEWTLPVRETWRPILLAALLLAARAVIAARAAVGIPRPTRMGVVRMLVDSLMVVGFSCGIAAGVFTWFHYQIRFCGGADSYGYVSAAFAAVRGELIQPQALAAWMPFEHGIAAATPGGWIATPSGNAIVPAYPMGFSLVMAIFIAVGGLGAAFYVPLVAGVGILIVTWTLTRRFTDPVTAAAATLVVAFNPVLTNMVVQPMSDVPAAFWFLLAIASLAGTRTRPVLAGVAFGLAVWTRPVTAAMLPGLLLVMPRSKQAVGRFIVGGLPVALAMAAMQWWLYGGPFRTGYGNATRFLTTASMARQLAAYTKWLLLAHSPLFLPALGLGLWRAPRRLALGAVTGLLTGLIPYLLNVNVFDEFDILRYLLPGLIPCVIVATMGVASVVRRVVPAPAASVVVFSLAVAASGASHTFVAGKATFQLQQQESRYVAVADRIRSRTPESAVILAGIHSGSLRLYAQRATLRWEVIPPGRLAATVASLARHGLDCYAAVDGEDEARSFQACVAGSDALVSVEPVASVRGTIVYRLSPKPPPADR